MICPQISNFDHFNCKYEFEQLKKDFYHEKNVGCEESFEKTCLKLCSLMGTFITHVAILDFKNEVKKKEILEIIHTLEIELKILKKLYK